ncbi:cbb3-type cytochrome c oxidase subunit 3 [bacterium]|nr:cbb3-type cytochrome c oxidase subunit 3 [bacterium]
MSLSEIMSAAGFENFAHAGLVFAIAGFALITIWVFLGRNRAKWRQAARMPLDEADRTDTNAPTEKKEP